MDPATIFQVIGTALSLADVVFKSIDRLSSMKTRYRNAPMVLMTLIGQLHIVKSALAQLDDLSRPDHSQHPRHQQLSQDIGSSLDSFEELILGLEDRLNRIENTESTQMGFKERLSFLWNEKDMREYSGLLDTQVNALTLLLQAMQWYVYLQRNSWSPGNYSNLITSNSLQQQSELMGRVENVQILRLATDCSTSIIGLDDSPKSLASENTQAISQRFDFDEIILNSKVYQQAHRSHLRKTIRFDNMEAAVPPIETRSVDSTLQEIPDDVTNPKDFISGKTVPLVSVIDITVGPLSELYDASVSQGSMSTIKSSDLSDWSDGDTQSQHSNEYARDHDSIDDVVPGQTVPSLPIRQSKVFPLGEWWRALHISSDSSTGSALRRKTIKRSKNSSKEHRPRELSDASTKSSNLPILMKSLLLGTSESGKSTIFNAIKIHLKKLDFNSPQTKFREAIWVNNVKNTRTVLQAISSKLPLNDPHLKDHAQTILVQPDDYNEPPGAKLCHAIWSLWSNIGFRKAHEHISRHQHSLDNAKYFAKAAKRIAAPGYRPTKQDIIYSMSKTQGLEDLEFEFRGLLWKLFDFGGSQNERQNLLRKFEWISTIIFTIDVACYSKTACGSNCMENQLELFKSIASMTGFIRTQFIIVFTKCDRLERWIHTNPPDMYLAGSNLAAEASSAEQYLNHLERQVRDLDPWSDRVGRYRFLRVRFDDIEAYNPAEAILEAMLQTRRSWYTCNMT